jgi:hypothetical protein
MTVCGIAELALEFFEQDFAPARRAVSVCNFFGPEVGVVFCGVITGLLHLRGKGKPPWPG